MKKNTFCTVVLLLGYFVVSPLQAAEMTMMSPSIPSCVEKDGTGIYQLALQEAAKRAGYSVKDEFYPVKRAIKNFTERQDTCLYSFYSAAKRTLGEDNVIVSYPLAASKLYIFTKKGTPPVTSVEQLEGKRVGGILGTAEAFYREYTKGVNFRLDTASSDKLNLEKLEKGRIDAMFGWFPDLYPVLDQLSYSAELPLFIGHEKIICHNTKEGKLFINAISRALQEMHDDGTLQKIEGNFYVDFQADFKEIPVE